VTLKQDKSIFDRLFLNPGMIEIFYLDSMLKLLSDQLDLKTVNHR